MKSECLCAGGNVLIFACSGGSNVGQISNEAAMLLDEEGLGKFYCLAGIGGNIVKMVEPAREAGKRVLIDGCPIGCGKTTLERAGLKADCYVVVTELGVKKQHKFDLDKEDIRRVVASVKAGLK
ncbi:MAG: putative zinc-binding protein [Bacillota bacterium]|nr:putative zinc-binding protein [Bacillota bacterium]